MKKLFIILASTLSTSVLQGQIAAGTSIQISIQGVPTSEASRINNMYPVSESGTINMPYIGRMRAAGASPEGLAAAIQSAYKRAEIYTNPTIQVVATVGTSGMDNQVVHLGGQIGKTGPIPYKNTLTLWQAVQAAGGPTEFGSLKRVKVTRAGKSQVYDLTNPQFMNIALKPDDAIEIPQKGWLPEW
jgi:protein involved in polysaccharide export with SLBB domain